MITGTRKLVGLVIPTLNAGPHLAKLLPALARQSLRPDRFLVMDSQSEDDTAAQFAAAGAEVVTIERSDFDHGGTRQQAVDRLADLDVLVFLTQDAVPADSDSIARLVAAFDDPKVGVAFGRQIPHPDATPIATHARLANYPPEGHRATFEDRAHLGFKTFFCSNSFAAYRPQALAQVGGFPRNTLFGEDALVSAMLLRAGWAKLYEPAALVHHTHNYAILLDFRRAFDIGAFHKNATWLIETFGGVGGEGRRFVLSELRYLLREAPLDIPSAVLRTALKALGYHLGRRYHLMPRTWARRFSLNRHYWRTAAR